MTVLAWCVIVLAVFVLLPVFMSMEAVALGHCKWWEPIAGWAVMLGVVAALFGFMLAIAWAIKVAAGG